MVSIGQLKNMDAAQRENAIKPLGTLARMKLVHLGAIALSKATADVEDYSQVLHDLTDNLWSEAKREEDINAFNGGKSWSVRMVQIRGDFGRTRPRSTKL